MHHIIGIDIGTTHVKALVATGAGEILYETKEGYPTSNPLPGYQEQNAEDIFQAVLKVLKQANDSIADKKSIACVSFSSAMHSLLAGAHASAACSCVTFNCWTESNDSDR